jgi:DNA-binding response OmpR family regulator
MEFNISEHARKRLQQRGIDVVWIARALSEPATTENDENDPTLAHALILIPERGFRVLRVIYNETIEPVTVVTAFFDDKVKNL